MAVLPPAVMELAWGFNCIASCSSAHTYVCTVQFPAGIFGYDSMQCAKEFCQSVLHLPIVGVLFAVGILYPTQVIHTEHSSFHALLPFNCMWLAQDNSY